jgi:hypothetical protein
MCGRENGDDPKWPAADDDSEPGRVPCRRAALEIDVVRVDESWNWYDIERLLRQRERTGWLHMLDTGIITQSPPPELKPKEIAFWRPLTART